MPRWITVRQRFDYRWPSGAVTHFSQADLGDHFVKDELADFAVERDYATEGKVDGSARSRKGGKKRIAARRRKQEAAAAKAPDARPADRVDVQDVPAARGSADRPAVDSDAG